MSHLAAKAASHRASFQGKYSRLTNPQKSAYPTHVTVSPVAGIGVPDKAAQPPPVRGFFVPSA